MSSHCLFFLSFYCWGPRFPMPSWSHRHMQGVTVQCHRMSVQWWVQWSSAVGSVQRSVQWCSRLSSVRSSAVVYCTVEGSIGLLWCEGNQYYRITIVSITVGLLSHEMSITVWLLSSGESSAVEWLYNGDSSYGIQWNVPSCDVTVPQWVRFPRMALQ